MGMWYRVFGRSDASPPAEALVAGEDATFESDGRGWLRGEIRLGAGGPLELERWTADDEGIRAELSGWAAYLETCDWSHHHVPLMERMIQTRQLFTVRKPIDCPDEVRAERLCVALCRRLAEATDGVYQADGAGFFAADGSLLVAEY
ncbi:MAG: hypothetical protein ACRC33_09280 [Gemmataceae bacterium]